MAGYTRQSTFADGDTITAALFNNEYNQLVNAFSNTTGHSHDGTAANGPVIGLIGDAGETSPNNKVLIDTTNNYIEFYVEVSSAPVQQLYIADGAIIPVTDSDIDLGTTGLRFKDAYIDTVTTTGNVDIGGNLTVTGNATISGNLTFGDADTDSINLAAEIDSDIIPNTDGTYDLGSATKEWQDLYIDGTANIDSLVADTADINGGTIDGATIATSDITVGAGKTLNVSAGTLTLADNQISGDKVEGGTIAATTITDLTFGSLNDGTITVTAFVDEDNMVSDSATLIPTQQSVKAYIDSQVTAQDLDFQGDSGGALSIDLDSESLTIAGGTGLDTVGSGNTVTINIDSTVATLTGSQTLTNKTIDVDNNTVSNIEVDNLKSGVLDTDLSTVAATDTTIASAKAIKTYVDAQVTAQDLDFAGDTGGALSIDLDSESLTIAGGTGIDTVGASNTLTINIDSSVATLTGSQTLTNKTLTSPVINTSVSGTAFLDDDTFATASATTLASSESIKAYVDAQILTEDTLAELNDTNITSPADGALLFYDTGTSMWIDNVVSGDITIADTGVAAISSGVIVNDDINASAAISISKTALVDGTGLTLTGDTLSVDAAQTQITSVGTLGSLTVSGDLTVDTSTLKVDSTNNRVGILNATPDVTLDIGSATDAIHVPVGTTAQRPTSPAAGYFRYNTTTGGFEGYTDAWGAIAGSGSGGGTAPAVDTMTGDGSDTTLTLTSAPVNENATVVTIDGVVQHKDTYSVSSNTLTFSEAPPSGSAVECITWVNTTINSALLMQDADGDTQIQVEESSDEDKIRFDTGGTERMIIDSTGVGIGISSPSAGLHVETDVNPVLKLDRGSANNTNANLYYNGTLTGQLSAANAEFQISAAGSSTPTTFFTNGSERMRIDSSGNVGIGHTSSFGKLSINSNGQPASSGNMTTGLTVSNGPGGTAINIGTYDAGGYSYIQSAYVNSAGVARELAFLTGSSEAMRIDSSGNVGIGTSSPVAPLHIEGKDQTEGTARFTPHSNKGNESSHIHFGSTGDWYIRSADTAGKVVINDGGGNVGIGTSSPSEKLTVNGALAITGALTDDRTSTAAMDFSGGVTRFVSYGASGTGGIFAFRTASGGASSTERMRINSSGFVGIGTSSPTTNLTIGGTSSTARIVPATDNVGYIGEGTHRWEAIYAVNGSIQTSDEREKTEIKETILGLDFIKDLKPVSYKWIDGKQQNKGKDEREHQGLIAQQVAETVEKHGIDKNTFGGLDIQKTEKYDDFHGMSYDQFIAPLIKAIQEQQAQIEALQSEINLLKTGE